MKNNRKVNIFWFRRDLRLEDNTGLFHALNSENPVLPVFIFDTDILGKLEDKSDKRMQFIHNEIHSLHKQLKKYESSLLVLHGNPADVFRRLTEEFEIEEVFTNHDYELSAIKRDEEVSTYLVSKRIQFKSYKDQVIFENNEVVKDDRAPYTIYTPYAKKWKEQYKNSPPLIHNKNNSCNYFKTSPYKIPSLESIGFKKIFMKIPPRTINIPDFRFYKRYRDYPAKNYTTRLSVHLRFGTISIRKLFREIKSNEKLTDELIWREFYMMILANYPVVQNKSFQPYGDLIKWGNNEEEFEKWKEGRTGYPLVDAGMRQLNKTGYMHNRARMISASFLVKHLLIDWRWGEAYFASKLLDYDLASNNGNWQWIAGIGCDAAPYFRVFNPVLQQKRYDPKLEYVKTWIEEFGTDEYPVPFVEHGFAVKRALEAYKNAIQITNAYKK